MIKPGDGIPYFELGGIDDEMYTPESWDEKKVLVVIFTCNHCPYAQAYEERIIALQKLFGVQGAQIVAINSNESVSEDSQILFRLTICSAAESLKISSMNFPDFVLEISFTPNRLICPVLEAANISHDSPVS